MFSFVCYTLCCLSLSSTFDSIAACREKETETDITLLKGKLDITLLELFKSYILCKTQIST